MPSSRLEDTADVSARAREILLEELTPVIESARAFAERWQEPYRVRVFGVALEQLLGSITTTGIRTPETGVRTAFDRPGGPRPLPAQAATIYRGTAPARHGLNAYEKLARALNLDIDSIERLIAVGNDGKLHILARIDGKTKKELQTKYSLVYLYVKEVALGDRMVDVEELRSLSIEHACYDVANFTGNFGKDVLAGLLRQQGEKGARTRKFLLSKRGLEEAATLLRELAIQ